ncbi:hypothetical protein OAH18_01190 [bacterium]|nr:hypothetical protein [bacterium]
MDEQSWFASDFFYDLLTTRQTRDDRKRRLICCAIGRTVLRLLPVPEPWESAVEFCEGWADGDFDRSRWMGIRRSLNKLAGELKLKHQIEAAQTIRNVTEKEYMSFKMAHESARSALCAEGRANASDEDDPWDEISSATERDHLMLAREVYGNPFSAIEIEAKVLAWKNGSVQQIANGIYESGDFASLGVLGDVLTEAGCTHDEVISHCYSDGHVRGCWVIDLIRSC